MTRLKSNRLVNLDQQGQCSIRDLPIPQTGAEVYLRGYGLVRVFVTLDANQEHPQFWATSDLAMTETERKRVASEALFIEEYHRGLKQCCGVERCQARSEQAHMITLFWHCERLSA